MGARRIWLDWTQPCLPAAAAWLVEHAAAERPGLKGLCDLGNVVCILPGRRAGRELISQLLERCEQSSEHLIPPRIMTPGVMFEELAPIALPIASEMESTLAWIEALKSTGAAVLSPLMKNVPAKTDFMEWHALASELHRLHVELAGAHLGFSDVADCAERMEMFSEGDRWRALQSVAEHYRHVLKRAGLHDLQTARQQHLDELAKERSPALTQREIVLVGVVELNQMQRNLLHLAGDAVVALLHANESLSDGFDALGCVIPSWWRDYRLGIDKRSIQIADRPDDQAREALASIATLSGGHAGDQITIGLADEQLGSAIVRHGRWAGVEVRSAAGQPLVQTAPMRFLAAAADYLREPRFASFATLLRHPDVEAWITRRAHHVGALAEEGVTNWLTLLDRYFSDYLHTRLTDEWLGDERRRANLRFVHKSVEAMLDPLLKPNEQPLGGWAEPALQVLNELLGVAPARERAQMQSAGEAIRDVLANFTTIDERLQPRVTAATAIDVLTAMSADATLPEQLRPDDIEMLGWLELHLDLAPVLIIVGCNDGSLPHTSAVDPFLPDSLRSALKLTNNDSRYARDAYLLEAIHRSRPQLTLVAGRRGADGDSLAPSRLLLACDPNELAERVVQLCGEQHERSKPLPIGLGGGITVGDMPRTSGFVIPDLGPNLPTRSRMSVTEFKAYLQCPYRYALSRLLRLDAADDQATELDALQFGSLAHAVLCDFGMDESLASSADLQQIERGLIAILRNHAKTFGDNPLPSVQVQMARLEQRLRSFARFQALHRAEGWRIAHCELAFRGEVALDVPGQEPMPLHGTIDRIDVHERTGAWLLIDYKTSDSGASPHQAHHECETLPDVGEVEWFDLQLPLYHYIASRSGLKIPADAEIRLGYICLPKSDDQTGLVRAEWTEAHIGSAMEMAREVVRRIRRGEFPLNPEYQSTLDPFSRICQTLVLADDPIQILESGGSEAA